MDYQKHCVWKALLCVFFHPSIESAWAYYYKGEYRLDNILFYANEYSLGDLLQIESSNGELYVTGLIEESGHSTIRILLSTSNRVVIVRKELKDLGCDSELSNLETLISVDIPPTINYNDLISYMEKGEQEWNWEYEEACISTLHRLQIQ